MNMGIFVEIDSVTNWNYFPLNLLFFPNLENATEK